LYANLYANFIYKSMNPNISISIIQDNRRAKKNNTYPVKIRVTHLRKQKYYTTGYSFSESDFSKIFDRNVPKDLVRPRYFIFDLEKKARKIVENLDDFTFERFERSYLSGKTSKNNLFILYNDYISQLKKEGKIGTAISYEYSMKSLQRFKNNLSFVKITSEFLKEYEKWMLANGKSITTVGIYLRSLKAIYNVAISKGYIPQEKYPFGNNKYQIPAGRNIKKALTIKEVKKIFDYTPSDDYSEAYSRDMWLFSYLCNGVNMKDIARLKYKNIDNGSIVFIRAKTAQTNRKQQKPIVAVLTKEAKDMINKWGNKPIENDTYIFPILENGLSPEQEHRKIHQAVQTTNKFMKRIGKS